MLAKLRTQHITLTKSKKNLLEINLGLTRHPST